MSHSSIFVTGLGFDVHQLKPLNDTREIMLCGVAIPSQYDVIAHSDGDVVLHALTDALLGAIGAGDIGEHFPPTEKKWKNADSSLFLSESLRLYEKRNAKLVNIDITIICETPKINPYKIKMKNRLSMLTELPLHRINIKATTTEKLGFLGRSEGIAAQVVVSTQLIEKL